MLQYSCGTNFSISLSFSTTSRTATDCTLPVASAQVKSCLLLAALAADGVTTLREPGPSRDHTERMLRFLGAPISGARRFQPV